ncbi:MAG: metalloregulator ArsR/SmtB family transcription factor [Nanoarchaeota archaeon]|nr:metalloregulator ArsR/SmtB family transcription factor [Nanoarchaeota archaeon]
MNYNPYHLFFQNLANPLKTKIIHSLKKNPKSVSELSKETKIEQSKLSHALANLKTCHIVIVNKKGKERIYSLNKKTILPILKIIDNHKINFCLKCTK